MSDYRQGDPIVIVLDSTHVLNGVRGRVVRTSSYSIAVRITEDQLDGGKAYVSGDVVSLSRSEVRRDES